ncbi:tape measure protein [Mycobacterium phage Myrna]|uniref:Tape measure protein n=1 Tax=Mycobacterium phage Myrna TaxID=546805 RepID=B5LJD2_9CAUD|nr:tail length tape measure protein [Mycobacterium phage Myrna]ACH62129.1 tape measure protein [Mycobacterium phage Myrna]
MTNPENFDYRDDSVVAKLSVDIPAATLTDLDQVRERVAAIRVENEAAARATGDWAGYLQSFPQIIEQANQAYRNMITQMERMSYIQQELGGSQPNVGVQGAPMGGQPGGAYSTAAPAGYVDPFMGLPGQGAGMNTMGGMTGFMQSMMMNDPRTFANMAAQRGGYVNPAQLGLIGGQLASQRGVTGGTGGGMGQGAPTPGGMTSQPTSTHRDSNAPGDQHQSGQPTTSEPQREPTTPHPDSPAWQQQLGTAGATALSVLAETRAATGRGGNAGGIMAGAGAMLGAIGRIGGHGGGGGGGTGGPPGAGGGEGDGGSGGGWGSIAKGAGLAGMAIGGGVMANRFIQNAGEQIQAYRNLGAQTGGGAVEGAGYEIQARMMAMNPFITLEQSRSIMQSALRNGYTGQEFDTVTEMMATNLKDMNMSAQQSMEIFRTTVEKGGVSVQDFSKEMEHLKDLTRVDGNAMSQDERNAAYEGTAGTLQGMGLQGQSLTQAVEGINEAFSDNQQLKNIVPQSAQSALQNPAFLSTMAQTNGVRGVTSPTMALRRMQEQGISVDQAYWKTLQRYAQMAYQGTGGDLTLGADRFMMIVQPLGVQLGSPDDYYELYKELLGGDVATRGHRRGAEAEADPGTAGEVMKAGLAPFGAIGDLAQAGTAVLQGNLGQAWNQLKQAGSGIAAPFKQTARALTSEEEIVADTQRRSAAPQATGPERAENRIRTEGNVSGEVRITVDQQGRVTAPQSIQLTGQQKGVNAGVGSLTMNNPSPGDPSFRHANGPFAQGPS